MCVYSLIIYRTSASMLDDYIYSWNIVIILGL